jgi:hypothetical protein
VLPDVVEVKKAVVKTLWIKARLPPVPVRACV